MVLHDSVRKCEVVYYRNNEDWYWSSIYCCVNDINLYVIFYITCNKKF